MVLGLSVQYNPVQIMDRSVVVANSFLSSGIVGSTFEMVFWKLEPTIPEDKKELATATLRSIALNNFITEDNVYFNRKH